MSPFIINANNPALNVVANVKADLASALTLGSLLNNLLSNPKTFSLKSTLPGLPSKTF